MGYRTVLRRGLLAYLSLRDSGPARILEPRRYRLRLRASLDDHPDGTTFGDGADRPLADSVLGPMDRRAAIIKADDLTVPVSGRFALFFAYCRSRKIPISAGLITSSLDAASSDDIARARCVIPGAAEVWCHGHEHLSTDGRSEFRGSTVAQQTQQLERSVAAAREKLGVRLRAFGAPGNATDAATATALAAFPQFETIFFEPAVADRCVLPRLLELEVPINHVVDLDDFKRAYDELDRDAGAIVLQAHPNGWGFADARRFAAIIGFLRGPKHCKLTTPTAYRRWQVDRDAIRVTKIEPRAYEIDARRAEYSHALDLDTRRSIVSPLGQPQRRFDLTAVDD